uniref:Uncharacterized protein n=2 Tax=Caenorhabditis japonica TaxID=281687 RepID=A0A8R1IQR0_CAEJA
MGCHLSRTSSSDDIHKSVDKSPELATKKTTLINRVPTQELRSAHNGNILQIAGKPIITLTRYGTVTHAANQWLIAILFLDFMH